MFRALACIVNRKRNRIPKNEASFQLSRMSTHSTSALSSLDYNMRHYSLICVEVEDGTDDGSSWGWFVTFPEEDEEMIMKPSDDGDEMMGFSTGIFV